MWTFRRLMLLGMSAILFVMSYGVYALFLGAVDGLPVLPAEWGVPDPMVPQVFPPGERERLIEKAFGKNCDELNRPVKLLVRDKGMIVSAGQFSIETDGRVKFSPFSAAMFPKNKDGGYPEIDTVRADHAYFTLDEPVQFPFELPNRKVMAVELRGPQGVTITNNRRTPEKSDDIVIHVAISPLFYEDQRNLIWTEGFVKLQDFQSQPEPTTVTGKGMKIHLTPGSGPNKPKGAEVAAKPKGDAVNNIELIELLSSVNMHLYVDPRDGFLGGPDAAQAPKPKAGQPSQKDHVFIRTAGTFTYDPNKELAFFDGPAKNRGGAVGQHPEQVLVSRELPGKKFDQLVSNHLKVQFRKKSPVPGGAGAAAPPASAAPGGLGGGDKEIEWALATVEPGQKVTLTMDSQNLEADGNELHYHCATPGAGPRTILDGVPMRAVKDGHKINALQLDLTGADKAGNGQRGFAQGPGRIDMTDKANERQDFPVHIVWKDTLVSTQEWDGGKLYDVWTAKGDAAYVDDEHKQELRGQTLRIWLIPTDPARGGPRASGGPKQRIHKIESFQRVFARSPEAVVKRADRLLIVFRPEVVEGTEMQLPEPPPDARRADGVGPIAHAMKGPQWTKDLGVIEWAREVQLAAPPAPVAAKEPQRRPVFLDADDVFITVGQQGPKKQLEKLDATGKVHVVQDAEKAGEKGLDITGELLNLVQDPKGAIVTVFGDSREPNPQLACIKHGETTLWGPKVVTNQITNMTDVYGHGAMEMPSKASIDNERPARPDSKLTVHWNEHMVFDGKIAQFKGGVMGYQDDARLRCESMQVVMDRTVVFKEGQKQGDPAKVERLVCNSRVEVIEDQRDEKGNRIKASKLVCPQLVVNNADGLNHAYGPGRFSHLAVSDESGDPFGAPGGKGPKSAPAKADPMKAGMPKGGAAKGGKEMKLTRIDFKGWMFSKNSPKTTYKEATFRTDVEVFNVPGTAFEMPLDADKLPKDGFFLVCQELHVLAKQLAGGKTNQSMVAKSQVFFRNIEVYGYCDELDYDDASDTIVFTALPGNKVRLFKRVPGKPEEKIIGEKILYNRKDGSFRGEGIGGVNSSWLDTPLRWPRVMSADKRAYWELRLQKPAELGVRTVKHVSPPVT